MHVGLIAEAEFCAGPERGDLCGPTWRMIELAPGSAVAGQLAAAVVAVVAATLGKG
jgi:hypothetical protein